MVERKESEDLLFDEAMRRHTRRAMQAIVNLVHKTPEECINTVHYIMLLPDCVTGERVLEEAAARGSFSTQFIMDRIHAHIGYVRTNRSSPLGVTALVAAEDGYFSPNSLCANVEGFNARGAVMLVREEDISVDRAIDFGAYNFDSDSEDSDLSD